MAKRKLGGNAMSPKDEVAVRPDAPPQACSGGEVNAVIAAYR